MLGKRTRGYTSKRPAKNRKTRGGFQSSGKYVSGNTRTGGLYRLRGRTIRRRGLQLRELKFYDRHITMSNQVSGNQMGFYVDNGGIALNANPMVRGYWYWNSLLTNLVAGTNAFERIGRKVVIKSLLIKLHAAVYNPDVDHKSDTSPLLRVMVINDKQANGALAAPADILCNPSGAAGSNGLNTPYLVTALPAIANRQRFQILYDKVHRIATVSTAPHVTGNKLITIYKRLKLPIEYGGTVGAISEIKSNNLILAIGFTSETGNGTDNSNCVVVGDYRLRYDDQ